MAYPARFRELLELELKDVEGPDYAWLTYAVCGVTTEACGWNGWMLDGIFKKAEKRYPTGTGDKLLLSNSDDQDCPTCGRKLFRTNATVRFEPSAEQAPIHGQPGIDYETVPMGYE
jgi:hypothetical protein